MNVEKIARELAQARTARKKLTEYPTDAPFDLGTAYDIQSATAELLSGPKVGWKIGATSVAAQQALGCPEPVAGPIFEDNIIAAPAVVPVRDDDLRIVEPEIGFRLATDLPPRDAGYTPEDVRAAIATVMPVIELVTKRLPGGPKERPEWIVADGAFHLALVVGPETDFATDMDVAAETVTVDEDGVQIHEGVGSNALGDPILALTWLANHLSKQGITLAANDIVATGVITPMFQGQIGASYVAQFKTLGAVSLKLTQM